MKKLYVLTAFCLAAGAMQAQCPISVSGNTTICSGQSTTLTASSTATSYTWNAGGINSSTISVSPTTNTTYTVIGTDGVCTDSATVTITVNATPTVTAVANPTVVCAGGFSNFMANGATSYTWTPSTSLSSTNGAVVSCVPLNTTTYTVYGTSGTCTDSATVTINVNPLPNLGITANPMTICSGNCSSLSGSGAMTYTWSTGATSGSTTVCPTTTTFYTLTGMDAGCTNTATVSVGVTQPPTLSVSAFPSFSVCAGSSAVLVASGATTYSWVPVGATTPTVNVSPTVTSTYTVCGTNGGCITCQPVTVFVSGLTAYTSYTPTACGQNNGAITIDSVGGAIPPLTYTVNSVNQGSNNSYTNLSAGNYSLVVTDSTGCSASAFISVNDSNFSVQLTPVNPTCNICDGSVSASIIGGSAPYTYAWNNGASTSSVSNLCAGSYQVSITDSSGCFTSSTISIASPLAPVIQFDSVVHVNCQGLTTGLARAVVSGGSAPYTYSWSTTPVQTTNIATGLTVGIYTLTVTDNPGCQSSKSIYIGTSNNIYVYPTGIWAANCGNNGSASIQAIGGSAPYTYSWSSGSTTQTATGLAGGAVYTFTVTDVNGCNGFGSLTVPNICMNMIKGRVYDDVNQNCVQDIGETGIAGRSVTANPGYYWASTNSNGDYVLFTPNLTNTVTVYNNASPYFTPICPVTATLSANFSQTGDTLSNVDFAYYYNPNYFDLVIHPGWTVAYPGASKIYWVYFENNSPTPQNVLIRFTYDPVLQYDSCNMGGTHFPSQHKIEWTYNNVPAGTWVAWTQRPLAYFTVPVSTPLSYNLQSYFELLPISGDANPVDNTLFSSDPITGSRDPNSKSVFPNGNILQSDSMLFYTVHFQNNGNDTAYRVVVVDTLSQYLDPGTIIPGGASHPFKFDLSGQGICTWTFDSIMLPDSLTNEPASNGSFNFTIKQKANNAIGTVINNTAGIYFDFNSAIITNTTVNTVVNPVSVPETILRSGNSFVIYPNPTSDDFVLRYSLTNGGPVVVELRNILGELVQTQTLYNKQKGMQTDEMNAAGLRNGIYVVRILQGNVQQSQKLIIQK